MAAQKKNRRGALSGVAAAHINAPRRLRLDASLRDELGAGRAEHLPQLSRFTQKVWHLRRNNRREGILLGSSWSSSKRLSVVAVRSTANRLVYGTYQAASTVAFRLTLNHSLRLR